MNTKIIGAVLGAVVLIVLAAPVAKAATSFASRLPRAELVGVGTLNGKEQGVYKLIDGDNTCYLFTTGISCVK